MSEIEAFDWTKQQKEIKEGKPLSPILIVKQDNGGHLIIADGFHRMCALFANDQELKCLARSFSKKVTHALRNPAFVPHSGRCLITGHHVSEDTIAFEQHIDIVP